MGSSPTWFLYPQGQLPKALGSFPTAFLLTPNHIKMGSLPVPFFAITWHVSEFENFAVAELPAQIFFPHPLSEQNLLMFTGDIMWLC